MNEINLNLVDYVIYDMNLNYLKDEIIDIGYIGYTKALNTYTEEKGTFVNYACTCIKNEILRYLIRMNRKKRIKNTISLNTAPPESDVELINYVPDEFDLEETVTRKIMFEEIRDIAKKNLSGGKYLMFELFYVDGYEPTQLSKMFGVNSEYFRRKRREIVKKLKEVLEQQ